eukprot:TRINITY_DN34070_c0_g1_i3.p1 TRINITY_DN34070_c0_g1~~TRINITY_DN34070_c0_g1_i3.p1  ORF type:complete len:201 (+),score=-15.54 TRINITY_DN34070_c0_g1_i3:586-1188(+)
MQLLLFSNIPSIQNRLQIESQINWACNYKCNLRPQIQYSHNQIVECLKSPNLKVNQQQFLCSYYCFQTLIVECLKSQNLEVKTIKYTNFYEQNNCSNQQYFFLGFPKGFGLCLYPNIIRFLYCSKISSFSQTSSSSFAPSPTLLFLTDPASTGITLPVLPAPNPSPSFHPIFDNSLCPILLTLIFYWLSNFFASVFECES